MPCINLRFEETSNVATNDIKVTKDNSPMNVTTVRQDVSGGFTISAEIFIELSDFDATKPGYDTQFLTVTLHEVGHTLGLDHPSSQFARRSVMNPGSS